MRSEIKQESKMTPVISFRTNGIIKLAFAEMEKNVEKAGFGGQIGCSVGDMV